MKRIKKFLDALALCALFSTVATGQGQVGEVPQKRIVGGESVSADEFPFVAKILYRTWRDYPIEGYYYPIGCTGSLIAPDKVLTAAHCVAGYEDRLWKINVGFGNKRDKYDAYLLSGSESEVGVEYTHQPAKITVHPNFGIPKNDVAILWLKYDVEIDPVRILDLDEENNWYSSSNRRGVAVGWGRLGAGAGADRPDTLQEVEVPVYTKDDCEVVLQDLRDQGKSPQAPRILEQMLCAGEENRATGKGDSGSPLLVQTSNGWAQVGVLSQSTRDPYPQTVVYMGNYMRTSHFVDWIFPRLHFAHSATGGGWETDLTLINPCCPKGARAGVRATVEVFRSDGTLRAEEQIVLQGWSMKEWTLPPGTGVETGGVVVTSDGELNGFLRFRYKDEAAASVPASPLGSRFMIPVSGIVDQIGLAIYNDLDEEERVILAVDGAGATVVTIPPQGKISGFIEEFFEDLEGREVQRGGFLRVTALSFEESRISVLALEIVNGDLVSIPAVVIE